MTDETNEAETKDNAFEENKTAAKAQKDKKKG